MNNRGFSSVFVLVILSVVLAFCLLVIQLAKTLSLHHHSDSSMHEAQLFAIYHVKAHFTYHTEEQNKENESSETEENDDDLQDEQEFLQYRSHHIDITYYGNQAMITIEHLQFYITYDETGNFITAPVYQTYQWGMIYKKERKRCSSTV